MCFLHTRPAALPAAVCDDNDNNNNSNLLFIKAHFQHRVLLDDLYSKNIIRTLA